MITVKMVCKNHNRSYSKRMPVKSAVHSGEMFKKEGKKKKIKEREKKENSDHFLSLSNMGNEAQRSRV